MKDEEKKRECEEYKKQVEKNGFITHEDFRKIIDDFEEDIKYFDERTKEQTQRLEKVEELINEVPEKLDQVNNTINDFNNKYFTDHHMDKKQKINKKVDKSNSDGKSYSLLIAVPFTLLIILSYLIYL